MKRPAMILCDLDGTLVDSVPDLAFCVDETMQALGLPPRGEARVRTWVGNGVDRLVKRALTGEMEAEPDADLFARAMALYSDLYQANAAVRSRLFPCVHEGLERFRALGIRLGCVTNKAARFTEPVLQGLGIREFFDVVVSGDTLPQKKPHPAPLLHASAVVGIPPGQSMMLGDSRHDVDAARAAGFAVVCVSYGYNHGEDIRTARPDAVIDAFTELPGLFC